MRGVFWALATLTLSWTLVQAASADGLSRSPDARVLSTKRQVIDCMNKQMGANRTLSYNDATRLCKDLVSQLMGRQTAFAAGTGASQAIASSAGPLKAVSAP